MRLIDADALLEELKKTYKYFDLKFYIDEAPTIEPIEDTKSCGVSADKSTDQNVADVPIDDTISRADAIDSINKTNSTLDEIPICKDIRSAFANAIKARPSADRPKVNSNSAEEQIAETCDRPKGEWLDVEHEPFCECSVCGAYIENLDDDFAFCPRCGADMRPEK